MQDSSPLSLFLLLLLLSCLCSSQPSLCEEDRLRMKLEFQKCLSAMDRCLVLPHAISRAKIHLELAARRSEREEKMVSVHSFVVLLFFFFLSLFQA